MLRPCVRSQTELVTDSTKLARKYADEELQLDMFRAEVGIFAKKGLDTMDKAAAAHRILGDKRVVKAARNSDAMIGSDLADSSRARQSQGEPLHIAAPCMTTPSLPPVQEVLL